jgi:diguanylate cyclase (GGDEF)-like protein
LSVIAAFSLENTVNRARLLRSGFTDALTGWHNRRYLKARLKEELSRSIRERSSLVCLMIDIDHFKRINDSYGHIVGDEVLSRVAQCISGEVRSSDVSARFGGEEFVILMPGTEAQAGHALAERIRRAVAAATFELDASSEPLPVTVSIGVAEHRPQPASKSAEHDGALGKVQDLEAVGERLIAKADRALYTAKAQGRNLVALANNG